MVSFRTFESAQIRIECMLMKLCQVDRFCNVAYASFFNTPHQSILGVYISIVTLFSI